jgi:transcriptional regulator with XRE-family HTH domain
LVFITDSEHALQRLGERLRERRLASSQTQQLFAQRIGVSVPTLRAMERGASTVSIGAWVTALWALGALDQLDALLPPAGALIARLAQPATRKRAPRRRVL